MKSLENAHSSYDPNIKFNIVLLFLLILVFFLTGCIDDFGDSTATEWRNYREANLLFSNSDGVYVLNLKTNRRILVARNGGILDYSPEQGYLRSDAGEARWSPDGRKIVYVEGNSGTDYSQMVIMNSDGTGKKVLVSDGTPFAPNWNRNGSEITYEKSVAKFGSNFEVFIINADGTNERQLTNRQGADSNPAFSRDGQKIVFIAELFSPDYTTQLFVMNKDGSVVEQLTLPSDLLKIKGGPSWSPVFDEIAFSAKDSVEPDCEIYLLKEPDYVISKLTNKASSGDTWDDYLSPSWSNDGKYILFTQYPFGVLPGPRQLPSIWIMNPNGSDQRQIIENAQEPDLHVRSY